MADDLDVLRERIIGLDRLMTAALSAQDEKVQLALSAAKEAITKAETATEKRFEGVNEFRKTLSDQAVTFANRDAVVEMFTAAQRRSDDLTQTVNGLSGSYASREKVDELAGRVSSLLILMLVNIVGVLVGALVLVSTR